MAELELLFGLSFDYIILLTIWLQIVFLAFFFPCFKSPNDQTGQPVVFLYILYFLIPRLIIASFHIVIFSSSPLFYSHSLHILPIACILWRQSWMCIIKRSKSSDILKRDQTLLEKRWWLHKRWNCQDLLDTTPYPSGYMPLNMSLE